MENGSLANVIKKFGALTEALAAIYIAQVLRGLKYLHDQGVLHRDIKGANILTSKDGYANCVKSHYLIDFFACLSDTLKNT